MKRLHIITVCVGALLCVGAAAQSFRTGYFLDNYVYGYRINPSQVSEDSFFSLALGNIDLQHNMNFGVKSFLYPQPGGKIVTGLNSAVSSSEFLGNLRAHNTLSVDENINIITIGASNGSVMHTFEINARAMATASVPRDIFAFVKKGGEGTYDLGGFYVDATGLTDFAYGLAFKLTDKLSVGARAHFLLGHQNLNFNTANSRLTLSGSSISIDSDVYLRTAGVAQVSVDGESRVDAGMSDSYIGGAGFALDLGVTYCPIPGLETMVSITDLGFISWDDNFTGHAYGSHQFEGVDVTYEDGSAQADVDGALEKLEQAFAFKPDSEGSHNTGMPMNFAIGAKYRMPFYEGLSVAALMTAHSARCANWFDFRVGATITPARILSATVNVGAGTFGASYGAALNLLLGPINLVLGTDGFLGSIGTIDGIPVPLGGFMENLHVGLGFAF